MRGVVIIAIGSHYGRWAANLAASIKWNNDIDITLCCDKEATSHYMPNHRNLFDKIKEIPAAYYHHGNIKDEIKAKLYLYDLSPYDETVYIDAENIFLPINKIDGLFKKRLTIQNRGVINAKDTANNPKFIHWGNIDIIKKQFDIKSGKFYNLFSEYIYFKKDKKTKKVFDDAKEFWKQLKESSSLREFNHSIPDEVPFMLSLNKNKIEMDIFVPTYWETAEKRNLRKGAELYEYYIYSMGGNLLTKRMKDIYNGSNSLTQMYCNKFNTMPFMARDKKSIISKRFLI